MDVTGDRSKVQCCKEHYCIGTWNVRSMNQGKLEVVKQEVATLSFALDFGFHCIRRGLARAQSKEKRKRLCLSF